MATTKRSSASRGGSSRATSSRSSSKSGSSSRRTSHPGQSRSSGSASGSRRSNSSAKRTRDHDQIREWAEARGGQPTCVLGTGGGGDTGLLRIDFPGYSGAGSLNPISWDEFFEKFDEKGLTFLYQDKTAGGKQSRFNKFVEDDGRGSSKSGSRRHGR